MSEVKCAQKAVKMRLRANMIMRTILTPIVFNDLNCYHVIMLMY